MTTTAERLRSYWGERNIDVDRLTALVARYWEIALFAALISLALGLRLWDLGARAVHHDESLHMFYAWEIFMGRGYEHVPFMHGPLQFFGSALMFRLFGDNDFTARLLYALAGSALVAGPYFLRSYLGRFGALFAAFLLAISPSLVYFSRFARGDIYEIAWALGLAICTWRYLSERKQVFLYGIPLFLVLGFLTLEVTFILAAILMVYLEYRLVIDLIDQIRESRELSMAETIAAWVILLPTAFLIAAFWPLLARPRKS